MECTYTFTFMHLADAFIQSDLHCIQVTVFFTFLSALAFPGNRTHDLGIASAMLYYLSYRKEYVIHIEYVCKVHQRIYFLRRLIYFGANKQILLMFFQSVIQSVVQYGICAWYSCLSVQLCVLLCVCIALCNVYRCELMLDSKSYGMRDHFLEEIPTIK